MEDFASNLKAHTARLTPYLDKLLTHNPTPAEISRPPRLIQAMRHGVLNGGKRLRPFFLFESAKLFGAKIENALPIAAALELLHCYSLIHDDLPAMDNDNLRRGKPTVHKAFDEATAILAGDALLTLAFEQMAQASLPAQTRLDLIRQLATAAGLGGMIGGQMLDLEAENQVLNEAAIHTLQTMKTSALFRFSCQAGPLIAGAPQKDHTLMGQFGTLIGLAFQLADDILDITADTKTLGKTAGKDAKAHKATLVQQRGVKWAKAYLKDLTLEAEAIIKPYGHAAASLIQATRFVILRHH